MNKKIIKFDVQKNVNPNFKSVWTTKKPYNILKGGRNSFKSSVIALKLAFMMISYLILGKKANVVVIRKVGNTIRDSVFNKIQWAIKIFGMNRRFKATVSPFKITHKKTGSTFYFYGQDDFQKLKSNDINDIIAVWYEEAAEFGSEEEFDQTNVTFMRQKHIDAMFVYFFWSYNPPRNPYHWINEWSDRMKGEEDYLVHISSYLDDELGFVTDQMLKDIERIKNNDYDYYRYIYLGEPVGLGTNVYNMNLFKERETLFSDDRIIGLYYSLDTGHSVSATTCGCYGLTAKGKIILLNTYYYSPAGQVKKMAPSELSEQIHMFITKTSTCEHWKGARIQKRTIDSAEAALRNQYYRDYGQHLLPIAKKKKIDMIDHVHDLLAQGRFYYLKNPFKTGMKYADSNDIFIEEHKKYQFDEKTLNSDDPKVIKEDDHTVDQFQYACVANAREWRLKG
ncbi:PBSX family phage terminase large subunit [Cytobacillus kochii]|uniref:PBSX family phage terminase large subunit n=1 Tax=Cytobacillus kochii TaxID=859143 RepID=UPI00203FEFB3|nr:PBSX family phage terminase large subunit [Cytobacillus kochii]MCM3324250.1 PBSX family phage terminase large subunit [Cytobacillus kochii]MCM3346681.1 PBSX family phage terminase large subunit [Cytobacillus kochii]